MLHTPIRSLETFRIIKGWFPDKKIIDVSYKNDIGDSIFFEDIELQVMLPNSDIDDQDTEEFSVFCLNFPESNWGTHHHPSLPEDPFHIDFKNLRHEIEKIYVKEYLFGNVNLKEANPMQNEILEILVNRDGLTVDDAIAAIEDVQSQIDDVIADSNTNILVNDVDTERLVFAANMDLLEEISDIIKNELGLEPDYADHFIM